MKEVHFMGTAYNDSKIYELIKRRRHQILVHSYIYFVLDNSIISNHKFDEWANELIMLQNDNPEISSKVELYDIFHDFSNVSDSSSLNFELDPFLPKRAERLLKNRYLDNNDNI